METDEELAAFYQAHKDDPDVWGDAVEPPPDRPRRRELSATITIRLNPEEAALIRKLAKETGQSYSEILRAAMRSVLHPRVALQAGDMVNYAFSKQSPDPLRSKVSLELNMPEEGPRTGAYERLAS